MWNAIFASQFGFYVAIFCSVCIWWWRAFIHLFRVFCWLVFLFVTFFCRCDNKIYHNRILFYVHFLFCLAWRLFSGEYHRNTCTSCTLHSAFSLKEMSMRHILIAIKLFLFTFYISIRLFLFRWFRLKIGSDFFLLCLSPCAFYCFIVNRHRNICEQKSIYFYVENMYNLHGAKDCLKTKRRKTTEDQIKW